MQSIPGHESHPSSSQPQTSAPVEMSELENSKSQSAPTEQAYHLDKVAIPITSPIDTAFATSAASAGPSDGTRLPESNPSAAAQEISKMAASTTDHQAAVEPIAIGPSIENIPVSPVVATDAGPVLVITLLLTSGARHPYKIDEKYLARRNVNVPGVTGNGKKDPFSISVYTLKELILREWREEWEAQPSSPSSIRLIYFGRLLDDKTPLKGMSYVRLTSGSSCSPVLKCTNGVTQECKFNAEAANVIHMTVRPQDFVDEEDAAKSKAMSRERDGGEATAGCRCVIL
jgi:hypothetical protein